MRWVAAILVVACASAAHAEASDPKVIAKRLFDEGRVLYDQGKFIEACVLFEKSNQLDPAIGTRLNLAECAEREGKPRAAWLMWIAAAAEFEAADDDARATFARKRADALAGKLATVVLRVAKHRRKGLEIRIGDRVVKPAAEIVERLDTSRIAITASAPSREPFSTTVNVAIGEQLEVEVPALRKLPGQVEDEPEAPEVPRGNPWFGAAIASGVFTAGAIGLDVYAVVHIRDLERQSAAAGMRMDIAEFERINASGRRWEKASYVVGGAVLVGLAATVVFVVKGVRRRSRQREATTLHLAPVVAPRLAGMQLDLRF